MVNLSPQLRIKFSRYWYEIYRKLPSIVCGITNVDEDIFFGSSGFKVFDDPSSGAVDADSVAWICSESKIFTALAGLKLVEQGRIEMDTPGYSPTGEAITKPATTAITFQHLLNFTSGLAYGTQDAALNLPSPYRQPYHEENPIGEFFKAIQGDLPAIPLLFEPGTSWTYGYSSECIGFVIERVTKQTLEEYCKEHIFDPLGLTSTSFYLTPDLKARMQSLTFRRPDGTLSRFVDQYELIEQDYTKVRLHFGGGGLYSSRRDHLIVFRHLLQISVCGNFFPVPGTQWQWSTGLCVNCSDWDGKRRVLSGFWQGWAGSFFFLDPHTGIAVSVGVQLLPAVDMPNILLRDEIERIIYANLEDSDA
ncbi:beta-lactamase/transpeptidase-like protein [Infundibulicybe gibba]|nr:beta-lactamase/transpeptidase-like protein [Infundibulicybe gibba]